jgi:hypothetical protein
MSEFCKCGSIIINGSCTNKSCSNKSEISPKARSVRAKASPKTLPVNKNTSTRVPRASKCITYSINDLPKTED